MNRARRISRGPARAAILTLAAAAALSALGLSGSPSGSPSASSSPPSSAPLSQGVSPSAGILNPPALAYYYMWFTPSSWSHTKTDLPALGAYDSTNPAVIKQHVAWAKAA